MKKREKTFILNGEYYYIPHHLFEGIYELYWVDRTDADVIVQNFCRVEGAEALAREHKAWRKLGCKITNTNKVTYEVRRAEAKLNKPKEKEEPDLYEDLAISTPEPEKSAEKPKRIRKQKVVEMTEEEKKKEARRKRREARKAKEKK